MDVDSVLAGPKDTFNILNDIEIQSQYLASSIDHLTENLCNLLHSVRFIKYPPTVLITFSLLFRSLLLPRTMWMYSEIR